MSDTQRMLAPQGLFQTAQPKPFDWQQPWSVPAAGPGAAQQGQAPQGTSSTLPHAMDALPPAPPAPYPGQPGGPYPQPGQYQPGGYPPGAGFQPGGGYPPQPGPGYPYGPGQYGPGVPGGPSGPRPWDRLATRLKLPKGPLGPAIVTAALVLVIAGAVALVIPRGGGGTGSTPAGPQTSPAATSSATSDPAVRQAATRLSGLLSQSANDHSDVNAAYTDVQSCGKDLAKDAGVFAKSAANRRTLLGKLAQLPGRSALNAAMLADLTQGWQASAQVDSYLAKWASAAASHCHKGNQKDPNLIASGRYESPASTGKAAFAELWKPLARKYGLPAVRAATL